MTREQHANLFLSVIVEGPHDWPVRDPAIDVGLRDGRVADHTLAEIRAGLTFSFAVASAARAH